MKVFVSWSGKSSGKLAEIFRQWIPGVIQAVRPYYSPGDIAKGTRWSNEIAKELEESRVGLICVTRENLEAPWLMFEVGALSKSLEKSRVCPILFGIEPTDLKGPMAQFQASKFQKTDLRRVVKTINSELAEDALANDVLDSVFDMWWPNLEEKVEGVLGDKDTQNTTTVRSERDLLEEILQLTRLQSGRLQNAKLSPRAIGGLLDEYIILVQQVSEEDISRPCLETLERMGEPLSYLIRRLPTSTYQKESGVRLDKSRFTVKDLLSQTKDIDFNEQDFDDIPF